MKGTMKRLFVIISLFVMVSSLVFSQRINRSFRNTPMPQALKSIAEASDSITLNFLYDDLEDFMVTTTISSKSVKDAIRQVVGFYPIRITEDARTRTISIESISKSNVRFKGVVKNADDMPLGYATVMCLSPLDSTFISGGVSNESGVFVIPCERDDVLLKVSYVGYATRYVRCTKQDVGAITLHESVLNLKPITISSKRMIMDADGYSISLNVRDMQTADLLMCLPNLSICDNTYCINGQAAEAIFVDGYAIANSNELCNLPSEMVSQVKVDKKLRTINIMLRNPESGGYYGAVNGGFSLHRDNGLYDRYAGGIWHSRCKGLTIYDKLDFDYYDLTENVHQKSSAKESVSVMDGFISPEHTQVSNRLSLTQELNSRHTIGVSYYIASNHLNAVSGMNGNSSRYATYYEGQNRYIDHEGTVRYSGKFGMRNVMLNLVADLYSRETSSENLSLYGAGVGTESGETPSIHLWKFYGDVNIPLPRSIDLRFGYDIRYFSSHYDPSKFVSNFKDSPALTYRMQLHGISPSAFGEINSNWKHWKLSARYKWQMNLALQKRDTLIFSNSSVPAVFDGDYMQMVFGTHASVSYLFGKTLQHNANLTFRHHLEEMPYAIMSPFIRWSDAYNYSMGNPTLRAPSFKTIEMGVSFWDNTLNISASSQTINNEIYWQTFLSRGQTDVFYTKPINLPLANLYHLYAELNLHPLDFWRFKLNAQLLIRPEEEVIGGVKYLETRLQQNYRITNHLVFPYGWSASLDAMFTPTYHIYDRTYHSIYNISGDVSKSLFHNRLQCRFSFAAFGNKRHLDRQVENMNVSYRYTQTEQSVALHLTWKFSRGRQVSKNSITKGEQNYHDIKDK